LQEQLGTIGILIAEKSRLGMLGIFIAGMPRFDMLRVNEFRKSKPRLVVCSTRSANVVIVC
jgi:hypothetical protein